jgi:hypothetical protein
MKFNIPLCLLCLIGAGPASAQGLYYLGSEAQESLPLKWVVGIDATYDDNVNPGFGSEEDSFGLTPYVGLSFVNITPQTTWDVYGRLGLIYYFDAPAGMDEVSSQSRVGANLTHRFSERLRFSSRNFVAYELEPDYSYGYATSRQVGEYFFWQSDNSIGFRWTERVATYTGLVLSGTNYTDVANNDTTRWELYNQFRYQLSAQTVLTADYRYGQNYGDGLSADSSDQYILGGVEHRFSPNTIGIVRAGIQLHDVDGGDSSSSPYLEFAFNSQVTQQFAIRSFARYGIESTNDVRTIVPAGIVEYDDSQVLRVGVSGNYAISPTFSLFGGIDYIPTSYASGRSVTTPPFLGSIPDSDLDIFNAYIGLSMKLNDYLTGTATYNFTNSSSDFAGEDYDRNRLSLGVSAEF